MFYRSYSGYKGTPALGLNNEYMLANGVVVIVGKPAEFELKH